MKVLVLLALFSISNAYSILQEPNDLPAPPQSDPNININSHAVVRDPRDQVSYYDNPDRPKSRAVTCDLNAINAATGDKLTVLVRDAPPKCLYGVFNYANQQAKDACNEADVTTIANAFNGAANTYDGAKPTSSPGILNFVLYLRACYFVQNREKATVGTYSGNLLPKVRSGLDAFFKRPNLEAQNDIHYEILKEVITLISNAQDQINYASQQGALLTKIGNAWKLQGGWQTDITNAIFQNFFLTHYDNVPATAYFCKHPEVAQSLNDFMDKQGGLLNTNSEWILRNAAGELGRFAAYSCLTPQVSGLVKKQSAKYATSGAKVYASLAIKVSTSANCASYSLCTYKADLEKKILPFTKSCDKTRTDTFKIRAQQISDAESVEICKRLKEQENYFHTLVKDNWKPVSPDTNTQIEVVIFNDVNEYKFYANILFGIDTNNGGMYLEGDPSKPGNIARYFCHEQLKDGKFDVWNLEHEFTHYLDGRYDMQGDYRISSTGKTMWWTEGFAEYAANKNQYPSMVKDCKEKIYSLSAIFNNAKGNDNVRVYHYGYLAARFMFEKHRTDVDAIINFFRSGQYPQYEKYLASIGSKYDQEFNNWCVCIANGKPC